MCLKQYVPMLVIFDNLVQKQRIAFGIDIQVICILPVQFSTILIGPIQLFSYFIKTTDLPSSSCIVCYVSVIRVMRFVSLTRECPSIQV